MGPFAPVVGCGSWPIMGHAWGDNSGGPGFEPQPHPICFPRDLRECGTWYAHSMLKFGQTVADQCNSKQPEQCQPEFLVNSEADLGVCNWTRLPHPAGGKKTSKLRNTLKIHEDPDPSILLQHAFPPSCNTPSPPKKTSDHTTPIRTIRHHHSDQCNCP